MARRRIDRRSAIALFATVVIAATLGPTAGRGQDDRPGFVGGCTSIMVGRLATTDGSVITSHTCDGIFRTWLTASPYRINAAEAKNKIYGGRMRTKDPLDRGLLKVLGEIPEARQSFAFLDTDQIGGGATDEKSGRPDSVMTVSPDGRWLYYEQRDKVEGDIMLVENFR